MLGIDNQPTILIVDDNQVDLDLLTIVLNELDVKLICAVSGEDALIKIDGVELVLAIIDVRMPEMTGYELAVKLNEGRVDNKVPVIFLTAKHFDHEEELQGYFSGAVDYIIKPVSFPILLSKVSIFLNLFEQKKTMLRNANLLNKSIEDLANANKQLKEREQKHLKEQLFNKALLDSIPGIYYLYTFPELKMVGWNIQHETIFGYRTDEMLGRSIFDWYLSKDIAHVKESINKLNEQNQASFEASLLTKNGRLIPFLLTAVKLESEDRQYLIGIGTNISERVQAEQALRDSEWILTKAQQIAHVGSWEYDYQTDEMKCSDETFRIFGFQPGEVTPSLNLFYNMVHREDYQLLMESIEDVKTKHIPLDIDLRIQYPNGGQGFVHEQGEMIFNTEGKPIKWIGTVHDITQRKRAEEEQQKSLEQLHQLSKYIEQVRENERLNLARELHDELGQALTAVKIDLEVIKQCSSHEKAKEKLGEVKNLVGETIRTVQRITSQLRPEIIDDLGLEAAIDWYSKEFSQRYGIHVFLDIESGIPVSNDDAIQLFRIMQESLTNIARHAEATHIEILLSMQGDFIQFKVTDNGVGITEENINSKKSFGIMSMKERAVSLGGTFSISRRKKNGSRIVILFPINRG